MGGEEGGAEIDILGDGLESASVIDVCDASAKGERGVARVVRGAGRQTCPGESPGENATHMEGGEGRRRVKCDTAPSACGAQRVAGRVRVGRGQGSLSIFWACRIDFCLFPADEGLI